MTESTAVKEIRSTLEAFFAALDGHDEGAIRRFWHPEATLFINGTELAVRPLSFLLSLPQEVPVEVTTIDHIDVHQVIATARAGYRLSERIHSGFFNLVKVNGRWLVANWIDHGVEER